MLTPGLSASFNIAWGRGAINPSTRRKAPDQTEYDIMADYRFPKNASGFLQGVWFRARSANWERKLI